MKTILPKEGSRWSGTEREVFIVLHTVEVDGHTWVHYRKNSTDTEYSCYVESFLQRFNPILE